MAGMYKFILNNWGVGGGFQNKQSNSHVCQSTRRTAQVSREEKKRKKKEEKDRGNKERKNKNREEKQRYIGQKREMGSENPNLFLYNFGKLFLIGHGKDIKFYGTL